MNDDQNIIKACQQGDRDAFAVLCESYYDFAFRVAFRMLGNEEDSRDVVQESLIRVWSKLPEYRSETRFTTWMYVIVTNLCIDVLRKKTKHKWVNHTEVLDSADSDDLMSLVSNKDLARIIHQLKRELSPKQQSVFVLRDLEGLNVSEISEITGMNTDAVKSNLCHARRSIRELLNKRYKIKSLRTE